MHKNKCPLDDSSLSALVLSVKRRQKHFPYSFSWRLSFLVCLQPSVPQNSELNQDRDDSEHALGWNNDDGTSSFRFVYLFCLFCYSFLFICFVGLPELRLIWTAHLNHSALCTTPEDTEPVWNNTWRDWLDFPQDLLSTFLIVSSAKRTNLHRNASAWCWHTSESNVA